MAFPSDAGIIPKDPIVEGKSIHYGTVYKPGYDVLLATNDVLDFLKTVPPKSAKLILTSPHYNMGKTNEKPVDLEVYLNWQRTVIEKCLPILDDGGSICWQSGNYVSQGETYPLDVYFYRLFKDMKLKLRNRIIWHFEHGLHSRKKFSGRYETILWFTKDDNYVFNLDEVRVPQKYPGKRAYKGPHKGQPTCNRLGKNPSDFWTVLQSDWEKGIWEIPNVKANHPEKTSHPSQFPIELAERLILALTNENDVVFDPFAGVGSSIVAAVLHKRRAMGVEIQRRYTEIAFQRITAVANGTLRRRHLGTSIFSPAGTERVANIPPEWQSSQT